MISHESLSHSVRETKVFAQTSTAADSTYMYNFFDNWNVQITTDSFKLEMHAIVVLTENGSRSCT